MFYELKQRKLNVPFCLVMLTFFAECALLSSDVNLLCQRSPELLELMLLHSASAGSWHQLLYKSNVACRSDVRPCASDAPVEL